MTDIVKMLRMGVTSIGVRKGDFPYYDDLMNKAADEIERLRKRVAELEAGDILDKDLRTYNGY